MIGQNVNIAPHGHLSAPGTSLGLPAGPSDRPLPVLLVLCDLSSVRFTPISQLLFFHSQVLMTRCCCKDSQPWSAEDLDRIGQCENDAAQRKQTATKEELKPSASAGDRHIVV